MAKDIFHEAVKTALQKDGWTITHDNNFRLKTDLLKEPLTIDLGAEKLIVAEKGLDKIAVEVKSFLGDSLVYDFHGVLGQVLMYFVNLEIQEPSRVLFLAIPFLTFEKMKQQRIFEFMFERYKINFIVFEPAQKVILEWKQYQN